MNNQLGLDGLGGASVRVPESLEQKALRIGDELYIPPGFAKEFATRLAAELQAEHAAQIAAMQGEQKPVAWRCTHGGETYHFGFSKPNAADFETCEPLYLHPAPILKP